MKRIIIVCILVFPTFCFSQYSGYLGKKNLIDLSVDLHVPVLYDIFYLYEIDYQKFFKIKNSKLNKQYDNFDFGLKFSYTRLIKSRLALGTDFLYERFNTFIQYEQLDYFQVDYGIDDVKHEALNFNSIALGPKIEFCGNKSSLPIGLSHQISYNLKFISLVNQEYLLEYSKKDFNGVKNEFQKKIDYTSAFNDDFKNQFLFNSISYGLNMRVPVANSLISIFSFKYILNFKLFKTYITEYDFNSNSAQIQFRNELYSYLKGKELSSVFHFNIGLAYSF